jgi:hypothetical protein
LVTPRAGGLLALAWIAWLAGGGRADAQLSSLISPGPLSRPHAALEGLTNCRKCHEEGRKVTVEKCLSCHQPIAARMARHAGVHATAASGCVGCHAEHAGRDGQLRHFDTAHFDHAKATGFALLGRHARVAANCAACHKARSFLTASPNCASCHADVHKGALGRDCAACHSAKVAFRELGGGFDHAKSAFPLVGAHRTVACTKCHVNRTFKGVKFATCTACHTDPHQERFGGTCTACHTAETWRTRKVDHDRTGFRLVGRHVTVDCAACHKRPAMRVKLTSDTCAACHVDVHRGTFRQDCSACHTESGFQKTPFDHSKTAFPLEGKHATLACASCHTGMVTGRAAAARNVADFRGLATGCASCHRDVHAGELGQACQTCHAPSSFQVTTYTHRRLPEFFTGQHASAPCAKCHASDAPSRAARPGGAPRALPVTLRFKSVTTQCATCHEDVHLGQEGAQCESCHSVRAAKFAATGFSHANAAFMLTGRHQTVACAACHKRETGTFPSRTGTAVRLKGVARECRACHADVHLGQMSTTCDGCHTTSSFVITHYVHKSRALVASGFFTGRHATAACQDCHKPAAGAFPAGRGTATRFDLDGRCTSCHTDVHRGALGTECITCHKP